MTYVIAQPCVDKKELECVDVCPVDAIHPTRDAPDFADHDQLYIDPAACIDCDECYLVCPHAAVFAEAQLPEEFRRYTELNARYFEGRAPADDA